MPGTVNTEFILDMQRKLYRWSLADLTKVHKDLFNVICDRRTLEYAWLRLARKAGSNTPGTDGVTRRRIEERPGGVLQFLEDIRKEMRTGTYAPEPVRERLIPKPGRPGQFRPLGIPTLRDRLVQSALKLVLEPIFEPDFYPTSFGFRPGRSTHDALATIQWQLHSTRAGRSSVRYVIEGDIKGCFDAIDHHLLMDRVRLRIGDRKVLALIHAFLKAGIMAEGTIRNTTVGTPQGGVISPLLANTALTVIDERYGRWTPVPRDKNRRAVHQRSRDRKRGCPTFFVVRYADDFVVLVSGAREDAEAERTALAQFLKEMRMELSMEKTKITAVEEGFFFLGYWVVEAPAAHAARPVGKLLIPTDKVQTVRSRIKDLTTRATTYQSLASLLKKLNPMIAGWRSYYRYAVGASREFNKLDWWLWQRILRWLRKKYPKSSMHELRRRFAGTQPSTRWRWGEGKVRMRRFGDGGTKRYYPRGERIANGWNIKEVGQGLRGSDTFWSSFNRLNTT